MLDGEVLEDTMAYEPTAEKLENLTFFVEEPEYTINVTWLIVLYLVLIFML